MPNSKDNYSTISFSNINGNICVGDCQGKFVLLGGKGSLHLVRLPGAEQTEEETKFEKSFSTAIWKPAASDAFITASSKAVELWQECEGAFKVKTSFNGYSRSVCDMDWGVCNTDLVAASSHSNHSFILDTRDFRRPCANIESVLPIYQMRWNKCKEHQVATCHGEVINVWDLRNLKQTCLSLTLRSEHLHMNSIDWCPASALHLLSSTLDGFLKFWHVSKHNEEPENLITFNHVNINSAKYAPHGRGIVAQCVSKAPGQLYLWGLNHDLSINQTAPPHAFMHSSNILQWFFRESDKETSLVAWSSEHCLKSWSIPIFLSMPTTCGGPDVTLKQPTQLQKPSSSSSFSSSPSLSSSPSSSTSSSPTSVRTIKPPLPPPPPPPPTYNTPRSSRQPQTLLQELQQLKHNLPNITIEKKSIEERELRALVEVRGFKVRLSMVMLEGYPLQTPLFESHAGTNLTRNDLTRLLETLRQTCASRQYCIEACLRSTLKFLESLQEIRSSSERGSEEAKELSREKLVGENIPFPRTSGARFCGPGFLVCFTRRVWVEASNNDDVDDEPERRKIQSESNMGTPRAMSALSEVASMHAKGLSIARSLPITSHIPSISQFFEVKELHKDHKRDNRPKVRFKQHRTKSPKSYKRSLGPVIIYDLSCLLAIQKSLGENYVFDSNPEEMCRKNALVALAAGRKDLQQVWSLLALHIAESSRKDAEIEHYSKARDVQTLAMLCCSLTPAKATKQSAVAAKDDSSHGKITSTTSIPPQYTGRRKHSNSLSESSTCHSADQKPTKRTISMEKGPAKATTPLLPASLTPRVRSNFVHAYCSILFQWGFNHQRLQLTNATSLAEKNLPKSLAGIRKRESVCVLCRMPVPGLFVSCFDCGHGGHIKHLSAWFSGHQVCASGCGCHCLTYHNVSMG